MDRKDRVARAKNQPYYPIALNIKNKLCVVAGGGNVAIMKVEALLKAAAIVRIVSPELKGKLKTLYKNKKIEWLPRTICSSDLAGAFIVIAATNNDKVNKQISDWAKKKKILINVVDEPILSDFISPAVFRKKEAIISVFTNGIAPSLSRDIKIFLDKNWEKIKD
ncbi:MAG: bifunctional precorrin-2 dehydrogenase/sirohydrochlorin ferrochelatase [Candidatus Omnitrophica bacterium]|nr:bifunctional precorrin-2 dehydrogenase/sirohydrochlorin ferrochelatase [Candidatus Omnitrophota bacterium]